ncbi:CAF17-like 4Fe-4S cluster assembly/insertion protein YgfZ [Brachybacterium huguangmaarense]
MPDPAAPDTAAPDTAAPSRPDLLAAGAVHLPGPDAAVPAHYGAPLREQRRLEAGRSVVDLAQMEVLEVSGADHRSWMTTISSQVLDALAPGDSAQLAVLTPQGRVEHLAAVGVGPGGSLLLVVDPGARAGLRRYLESMRFAARVEITDRDDLRVLGAVAPAADVLAAQGLALPDPEAVVAVRTASVSPGGVAYGPEPEDAAPWFLTLVDDEAARALPWREEHLAGMLAAEALRIASHRARFATEVDDRTIPHELDLLRHAVHTAKGCYRGQETVAKVLNLGQPPRRLVMLHLDGSQDVGAVAGSRVLMGDKEVGTVTTAAMHADLGPVALAVVRRAVPLDAPLEVAVALGDVGDDDAGTGAPTVRLDAAQEAVVVPRDHGQRPPTARL